MERLYFDPYFAFRKNWPGWGSFLGTGVMARSQKTPRQWVCIAEKLASSNKGKLHSSKWLQANGYGGLVQCKSKYPGLFSRIDQEVSKGNTPDEWVLIAEQLAAANKGFLPIGAWLTKQGYGGLVQAMYKNPGIFNHLAIGKTQKSASDWVSVAEDLAAKNNGILHCKSWLQSHGYKGMVHMMYKHSELFTHIRQERRGAHGRIITIQGESA